MRILALDPATVCGWCEGDPADGLPSFGSVRLRRKNEPVETAPFNMLRWLRDRWVDKKPDRLAVEAFMNPAVQKSADAIVLQLQVYGVIMAMAQEHGILHIAPSRIEVLRHFIGRSGYGGDRPRLKAAVLDRCHMTGLMPKDADDIDAADAIAVWDWAVDHWRLAGKIRSNLVLFEP